MLIIIYIGNSTFIRRKTACIVIYLITRGKINGKRQWRRRRRNRRRSWIGKITTLKELMDAAVKNGIQQQMIVNVQMSAGDTIRRTNWTYREIHLGNGELLTHTKLFSSRYSIRYECCFHGFYFTQKISLCFNLVNRVQYRASKINSRLSVILIHMTGTQWQWIDKKTYFNHSKSSAIYREEKK